MSDEGSRRPAGEPEGVQPGALSALLRDLIAAPASESWSRGLRPGAVVGRFELVRELGRGGFGIVFEARDRELGRAVAFKAVRPGSDPEPREERLLQEAETAARLAHPNIVHLYDAGRSEQGPYLVLELLHGQTLAVRLAQGPVSPGEALRIAREVATGVAHAHAHGVVHRDLKPENVFLCDDGQVKVLDFGLAHAFGRRRAPGGTPGYMAPEQRRGAPEDERTDVFALGMILYRMLAGAPAFAERAAPGDPAPAPAVALEGAPAVGPLLARMLEADPVKRPRDAGEVAPALSASLRELETSGTRAPATIRRRRSRARSRTVLALGAAGVLLAAGLAALSAWRARVPPSASAGPAVVGRAAGRALVAVADVANTSGDRELDALGGLLATSLEQSRRIDVLSRARMREVAREAGRGRVERVDEDVALDVGRRAGARALLVPGVQRLGSAYVLDARVVDPATGGTLFTVVERARVKEEVLSALDALSDRVRRELGEGTTEVAGSRVEVGSAVTRDLEAYRHYARGIELRMRGCDFEGAEREQRKALELDPDFAAAHLELGNALVIQHASMRQPEAVAHFRAAYALASRMPEKERMIVELDRFITIGQMGEAERHRRAQEGRRLADALAERYPYDAFAVYYAGVAHSNLGGTERAIDLMLRAQRLDPGQCFALLRLLTQLKKAGRVPEALEAARSAAAASPTAWSASLLASALRWSGALEEAAARAREALRADPGDLAQGPRCILAATGHPEEAERGFRHVAEAASAEGARTRALSEAALMAVQQGRVGAGLREWRAIRSRWGTGNDRPGEVAIATAHLLAVGRTSRASSEVVSELRGGPPSLEVAAWLAAYGAPGAAAEVAREAEPGDPAEALYRATWLAAKGPSPAAADALRGLEERYFHPGDQWLRRVLLGETLLALGRAAEAVDALSDLESVADFCGPAAAAWYPRALLIRGRALAVLGRRREALVEVDRLLALWRRADPDLPLLGQARALRRRLAGGGPVRAVGER